MNPNQALWEKGDFTRIAETFRESGEDFVKDLGIQAGFKVLDLGSGDGTTAVPAAKRGAHVLGIDIARNLVDAGNRRAQAQALSNLRFQEGDATNLVGIPDATYDLVQTCFGAMFAPKPDAVAREMVRVTKKGGRIVMGNWIPNDPTLVAQILKISSAFSPPPPEGFVSPMLWGVEAEVTRRFEAAGLAGGKVSFARATCTFRFPEPPATFVELFRQFYGPTMNAFDAAEKNGKAAELKRELTALFEAQNRASDKKRSEIPATYLKVTVAA